MCAMCRMFWTTTHCQAVFPQPPVVIVTLDGILQGQKCLAPEINTHTHTNYTLQPILLLLFWFRLKLTHTHTQIIYFNQFSCCCGCYFDFSATATVLVPEAGRSLLMISYW